MTKPAKVVLSAIVVLVLVVSAGVAYVALKDSADDQANLNAIGGPTTTAAYGEAGGGRTSADGAWKVQAGEGVFVGYRVHEKLRGLDKEVTGRTPGVTGTMTVAGSTITAAEVTGDLAGLKSDDPLRDGAISRMGPETGKFPEATFKLTGPLALPAAPVKGQKLTVTAAGELTAHGVTRPVQMPLEAQWDGDTIKVATTGNGVRFAFADFGFSALKVAVAETDDFGFIELQLLFVPA